MMDDQLIPYENFDEFLCELQQEEPLIKKIRAHAIENHVPVIPQSVAVFLTMMIRLTKPQKILELGTATGLSALTMAQSMPSSGRLYTVELNDLRIKTARQFISESSYEQMIEIIQADFRSPDFFSQEAAKYAPYDFVFIDAAKGKYHTLVDICAPLVRQHGLIVLDDVLQNQWVINMAYPKHRNKTAVVNLRHFLQNMSHSTKFHMSLFPIDDGIVVLEKLVEEEDCN